VGRTFLGIADRTGDGRAETVLILVASHATQTDAILTLQRFGAISAVMLDGGGSTQAIALGQTYVTSSDQHPRAIPHAIGILSGTDITHNLEL
jgi:exopolysaccharide biosynthesis protein